MKTYNKVGDFFGPRTVVGDQVKSIVASDKEYHYMVEFMGGDIQEFSESELLIPELEVGNYFFSDGEGTKLKMPKEFFEEMYKEVIPTIKN